MKNTISAIVTGTGVINVVVNGKPYSFNKDSMYYQAAKDALVAKDYEALRAAVDLDSSLRKASNNKVVLENGVIKHNGLPINNALTARIYALIREQFPFEGLLKFLENVLKNPDASAVADLYTFLEKNSLPITEDGCFLAWKYVRDDFKDCYTGTKDNSPGQKVWMLREEVNKNRNETCSSGLHVCSHSYLPKTTPGCGKRIVLVKVNPKDCVSVPVDYNNAKMRVCEYFVLEEVLDVATQESEFQTSPVYGTDTTDYGVKPDGRRYWSVRKGGKFAKKQ